MPQSEKSTREYWRFQTAGSLIFGRGAVDELGHECARRGWRRLLLLTAPTLVRAGHVERVVESVAGVASTEVIDACEPHPALGVVQRVVEDHRANAVDAVVGLGGGSCLDVAKLVAAGLAAAEIVGDKPFNPQRLLGLGKAPSDTRPIVAVPTTAGTGSEVSSAAVLVDEPRRQKVAAVSHHLIPALAVVDPSLTDTCPPQVTAESGADALTHAIEALTVRDAAEVASKPGKQRMYEGRHPLGVNLAEQALLLIADHLEQAVHSARQATSGAERPGGAERTNDARDAMSLAATLAGMAFSSCGVGLVHAMEFPIGHLLTASHGAVNAVLLPHVMRFNLAARPQEFARIAVALGGPQRAEDAPKMVADLLHRSGLPVRLRDLGVRIEQLPELASAAVQMQPLTQLNPQPASAKEITTIYEAAF